MIPGEEDENEIEPEDDLQLIQEQIRELLILRENTTQIPDSYIIRLLKPYLAANLCQNRGYVLDGYPYLTEQVIKFKKNVL